MPLQKCPTGGLHQSTQILRANPPSVTVSQCHTSENTSVIVSQHQQQQLKPSRPDDIDHPPTHTHTHTFFTLLSPCLRSTFSVENSFIFFFSFKETSVCLFFLVRALQGLNSFMFRVYRYMYCTLTVAFTLYIVSCI